MKFRTQNDIIEEIEGWLSENTEGGKPYDLLSSASGIIDDLRSEVSGLRSELEDAREEIKELENGADEETASLGDAVNELLDGVERPLGTLRAVLPDTPANQRAIIALYDATGRNL